MNMNDELTRLKKRQQQILDEYEELLQKYDSDDLIHQNELLQARLAKVTEALDAMQREHESISAENRQLKISLKEQMLDEKLNILKISQDKLNTYFNVANESCQNRLIN